MRSRTAGGALPPPLAGEGWGGGKLALFYRVNPLPPLRGDLPRKRGRIAVALSARQLSPTIALARIILKNESVLVACRDTDDTRTDTLYRRNSNTRIARRRRIIKSHESAA